MIKIRFGINIIFSSVFKLLKIPLVWYLIREFVKYTDESFSTTIMDVHNYFDQNNLHSLMLLTRCFQGYFISDGVSSDRPASHSVLRDQPCLAVRSAVTGRSAVLLSESSRRG